jgi:hypothetical protein
MLFLSIVQSIADVLGLPVDQVKQNLQQTKVPGNTGLLVLVEVVVLFHHLTPTSPHHFPVLTPTSDFWFNLPT